MILAFRISKAGERAMNLERRRETLGLIRRVKGVEKTVFLFFWSTHTPLGLFDWKILGLGTTLFWLPNLSNPHCQAFRWAAARGSLCARVRQSVLDWPSNKKIKWIGHCWIKNRRREDKTISWTIRIGAPLYLSSHCSFYLMVLGWMVSII